MSLLSLSKKILSRDEKKPAAKGKSSAKTKKSKKVEAKKGAVVASVLAGEIELMPIMSEKSIRQQAGQTIVVRVKHGTSKGMIARAMTERFGVVVKSVRTSVTNPKTRRRGLSEGKTINWKKAYITVDDISKINLGA